MPTQLASPLPIAPGRRNIDVITPRPEDLFASLNATLASKVSSSRRTADMPILQDDYTVPAPPPPSPVSSRHEGWGTALRR